MVKATRRRKPAAKGYHHGDLRNALIHAALALVAEGHVTDLSLREVARRAGVTYAAPYHHFTDKSGLLAAVACQGFEKMSASLKRATSKEHPPQTDFIAMAKAYVQFAKDHPSHYRVMFLPDIKESPDADALRAAADRAFESLMTRVARARPDEGEADHRTLAITVWAALHGLALLAVDGILEKKASNGHKVVDNACRSIAGMVFPGVGRSR